MDYIDFDLNRNSSEDYVIIHSKIGDVTGDNIPDTIHLLGIPFNNGYKNITLAVIDGKTANANYMTFEFNSGHFTTLFIGDFTGNTVDDIFISITNNDDISKNYYYLFESISGEIKSIFNFVGFNKYSLYSARFRDYNKVDVIGENSKLRFSVDISNKPPVYINNIYFPNGELKENIYGKVTTPIAVSPIDYNNSGVYSLLSIQRVYGLSECDGLGFIETFLSFNGKSLSPKSILFSYAGESINSKESEKL